MLLPLNPPQLIELQNANQHDHWRDEEQRANDPHHQAAPAKSTQESERDAEGGNENEQLEQPELKPLLRRLAYVVGKLAHGVGGGIGTGGGNCSVGRGWRRNWAGSSRLNTFSAGLSPIG
jgi:hypothetical protein